MQRFILGLGFLAALCAGVVTIEGCGKEKNPCEAAKSETACKAVGDFCEFKDNACSAVEAKNLAFAFNTCAEAAADKCVGFAKSLKLCQKSATDATKCEDKPAAKSDCTKVKPENNACKDAENGDKCIPDGADKCKKDTAAPNPPAGDAVGSCTFKEDVICETESKTCKGGIPKVGQEEVCKIEADKCVADADKNPCPTGDVKQAACESVKTATSNVVACTWKKKTA